MNNDEERQKQIEKLTAASKVGYSCAFLGCFGPPLLFISLIGALILFGLVWSALGG